MSEESIDQLHAAILKERNFRDTLVEYCNELAAAIVDLEEQKEIGDAQSSEWKTRYEIQQELNEQLRKQSILMREMVEKASKKSHDFQKSARTNAAPAAFGIATEDMLKKLAMEKQALSDQLLNIELRIEQEAKGYHKANEERKAVHLEIAAVNSHLAALKPTAPPGPGMDESAELALTVHGQRSKSIPSLVTKNIAPNQRVIDAKLGPIRKTAAVKQLPPL